MSYLNATTTDRMMDSEIDIDIDAVSSTSPTNSSQSANGSPQSSFTSQSTANSPIHNEKHQQGQVADQRQLEAKNQMSVQQAPVQQVPQQFIPQAQAFLPDNNLNGFFGLNGNAGVVSKPEEKKPAKKTYRKIKDEDLQGPFKCQWKTLSGLGVNPLEYIDIIGSKT
ncbi:hypothetical protein QCA50_009420 [Cerrena zonata]|uniref:Uncharacterized protein n=1 Tax=Cerrena zonata TaxID=2478898 RepID=A0AAW0G2G7_9APHY